jgi:hypothetical protein
VTGLLADVNGRNCRKLPRSERGQAEYRNEAGEHPKYIRRNTSCCRAHRVANSRDPLGPTTGKARHEASLWWLFKRPVCSNRLPRVIVEVMKRQLIALILLLAVTLQGSLVAFAGVSAPMSSHCATSAPSASQAQDSCCPSGTHTVSCCQDACPALAAVLGSPLVSIIWNGRSEMVLPFHIEAFCSRGDSPLIRPPIL